MDKVNEFLVKNIKQLESTSSVPEVAKIAVDLAKEQNVPEVISLAGEHLLIGKLTAFFGWCHATEDSINYAIECMEYCLPKIPNYGYKVSLEDFMSSMSFALGNTNEAIIHMPLATWKDLCMHFYSKVYPED